MKLGEIKLDALRLMHANVGEQLALEHMDVYYNSDEYRDYLWNMPGAITRCLFDLEEKRILPTKEYRANESSLNRSYGRIKIDVSSIDDIHEIDRISFENSSGDYGSDIEYVFDGDFVIIDEWIDPIAVFTVHYLPSVKPVTMRSEDSEPLANVPDKIAALIPYFIKAELYREEEPEEAAEARNWYEAATERLRQRSLRKYHSVRNIYSQTGC
ncbi:MAG: hypothetical protein IJX38_01265 [Clostridia bacterium]|nr:hypothetical protein [Clostridia bacterium]